MYTSTVLAQILGMVFSVLGLSMVLNKKWMTLVVDEMFKNQGLTWLAGLITLLMGATIVVINNIWTSGLPLIITILGWLTLLKGVFLMLFPNISFSYYKKMNKENVFVWGGLFVFILGVMLLV